MIKLKVFPSSSASPLAHIVPNVDHLIGCCALLSTSQFGLKNDHPWHICSLLQEITLMTTSLSDVVCLSTFSLLRGVGGAGELILCVCCQGEGSMECGVFMYPCWDIRRSAGVPLSGLLSCHITPSWLDLGVGGLSRTSWQEDGHYIFKWSDSKIAYFLVIK